MIKSHTDDIFNKSGYATLSDFKHPQYQEIFHLLEAEQEAFLRQETGFRSKDYQWPSDSLHTWSRIWEYPYVYSVVKENIKNAAVESKHDLKIIDLGSGVTFFPFTIARLGCEVLCVDIDTVCISDMNNATDIISAKPGKVSSALIKNNNIPIETGEVDIVYCISVLEHINDFKKTIDEILRILRIEGLLILTIDIDACGYLEIGIDKYNELRNYLSIYFELKNPEFTHHLADILQTRNSPISYNFLYSPFQKFKFEFKQAIKPLLGEKPIIFPNLSVWGGVFSKKSDNL